VFINLLGNAVKFSPDGGTVSVRVQRDAARFCVEIRDEGPGIEPALRERVFDPFYQIDGSATRKHGGAGLGLALCRQFVRLHGGDIQIDSGEPSGTLVRFWLPVPTVTSRSEETGMRLSLAAASLG
jgi:signal transduction histidine kinase